MLGKIGVSLAAAAGLGIGAANASAVSLAVRVAPSTVHPGERYTVTIAGSYARRTLSRSPYLLAFIQYSGHRCRSTAPAEYRLPQSEWDWDYRQHAQASSPFRVPVSWKAGRALGPRRVCAYLYARQISPASTTRPLVRASASFSNNRPPAKPTH
ncbi:MAG TPA: hypothetical protein VKR21_01910 [Solirubrobacteraceae bacterium]|nr:hypothetical protein [Solirubrobacteraceae bacterium]